MHWVLKGVRGKSECCLWVKPTELKPLYDMVCNGEFGGKVFKSHKCRILGDLSLQGNSPIECEDHIDGHTCLTSHNPGKEGYCWWVKPDMLTLAEESVVVEPSVQKRRCRTCKHSYLNNPEIALCPVVDECSSFGLWEPLDKKETPLEKETYTMKPLRYKLTKELTGKAIADSACRGEFELFVKDYGYHTPVDYTEEVEKDFLSRKGADGTSSEWIEFLVKEGYLEKIVEKETHEKMIYFHVTRSGNIYKLHNTFGTSRKKFQWCAINGTMGGACGVHETFEEAIGEGKRWGELKSFKTEDAAKAYAWLTSQLS